jgi:hypothetical protein
MHAECNGANDGATEGEQAAARGLEDALIQESHAKQQREPNCLLSDRMEWLCNVGVGSIGALQSRRHALRSAQTEVCALTPRVAETRMQFSCTDPRRSWLNNECTHTSNDATCLSLCCLGSSPQTASPLPRKRSACRLRARCARHCNALRRRRSVFSDARLRSQSRAVLAKGV